MVTFIILGIWVYEEWKKIIIVRVSYYCIQTIPVASEHEQLTPKYVQV
jgi:hypothetical protein